MIIPFNKPFLAGNELKYIAEAHESGSLAGDGKFTDLCSSWLVENLHVSKALLTHSRTAALEMAALLIDIKPGDEVILPSYTFVSTANAFVLRGAKPVFVDVQEGTFNLDPSLIEECITPKTKAIIPVHYAGVSCDMDPILAVANRHNINVVEDAAQSFFSTYKGGAVGTLGNMSTLSFHETKNIISGEGGALLLNNEGYSLRAEIIREKGTNRKQFFRGAVDKYSWVDCGSSYLPGELTAAFLWAQLQAAHEITNRRLSIWNKYHNAFADFESRGFIRRPIIPPECGHNGHMYYLIFNNLDERTLFIHGMKNLGVQCVFHYVPLHSSEYGRRVGRFIGNMSVTQKAAECLVRLPMWLGVESVQDSIINYALDVINEIRKRPKSMFLFG